MIALFRFHIVLFPQLDFVSVFFLLVNPKRKASRQTGKKAASNIRTRVFFTYSTQSSSCSLFFLCALAFFLERLVSYLKSHKRNMSYEISAKRRRKKIHALQFLTAPNVRRPIGRLFCAHISILILKSNISTFLISI